MRTKEKVTEKDSLTDVAQLSGSGLRYDEISHGCWRGGRIKAQEVGNQAGNGGGGHRCSGDGLVFPIIPGGRNVGSWGEYIDDRSVIGVPCPVIGDIGCTNSNRLGGIRWAEVLGVRVGVTL